MFGALALELVLHAQPLVCRACDPARLEDARIVAGHASALSLSVEFFAWRVDGPARDLSQLVALVSLTLRPDALLRAEPIAVTRPRSAVRPGGVCRGHDR